jgi:excisionase family DNA binding protein
MLGKHEKLVEVVGVTQIARTLGITKDKVLRWIATGALKAVNVGDGPTRPRWRILRADFDTFMASRQTPPRPAAVRRRSSTIRDYFAD